MRNEQYDLSNCLPRELRLQVYKEAVELYKNGGISNFLRPDDDDDLGLCLLLPCVLWDLHNYLSKMPNGAWWYSSETAKAFPEIEPFLSEPYKNNKLRMNFLTFIIERMENEEG